MNLSSWKGLRTAALILRNVPIIVFFAIALGGCTGTGKAANPANPANTTKPIVVNPQPGADAVVLEFAKKVKQQEADIQVARTTSDAVALADKLRHVGNDYRYWGWELNKIRRSDEADQKFTTAEERYQEAADLYQKNHKTLDAGIAFLNKALLYRDMNKNDTALDSLGKAVALYRSCSPSDRTGTFTRSQLIAGAAGTYGNFGDARREEQLRLLALDSSRAAGNHSDEIILLDKIVEMYFLRSLKDPQYGPQHKSRLAELMRKADEYKAPPNEYVVSLSRLGEDLVKAGEFPMAVVAMQRAVDGWRGNGVQDKQYLPGAYIQLAVAYLGMFRREEALGAIDSALSGLNPTRQSVDVARCRLIRALIGLSLHDKDAVSEDVRSATDALRAAEPDVPDVAAVGAQLQALQLLVPAFFSSSGSAGVDLSSVGLPSTVTDKIGSTIVDTETLLRGGQPAQALAKLNGAKKDFEGNPSGQFRTLFHRLLGECLFRLNRLPEAQKEFADALDIYEGLQRQVGGPRGVGALQENVASLYQSYGRVLVAMGKNDKALQILNRGREDSLARLAAMNHVSNADLLRALNSATGQGAKAASKPARTPTALVGKSAHQMRSIDLSVVSRVLGSEKYRDTLVLEYAVADEDHAYVLTLSGSGPIQSFPIKAGTKVLAAKVKEWRSSIDGYRSASTTDDPRLARELFDLLMAPLESKLLQARRFNHLAIIADDVLLDLPFAALLDANRIRLIERFAISNPSSLSAFLPSGAGNRATRGVLAVANPAISDRELPVAEKQARELLTYYPNSKGLFNEDATKEKVLGEMGNYRLLHFGVHGEIDTRNGFQSRLLLAGATTKEQSLTAAEISEKKLKADLAVLSACSSAQGERSGGLGLLGMAWAFHAAGCPRVIASQWEVEPVATSNLMRAFYSSLKPSGTNTSVALQAAMTRTMRNPQYSSPYYWAAFQVMGTGDALER